MGISLAGKRVLITGASSGIGRACAAQFAQLGAHLVLCARRQSQLEALALDLRKNHGIEVHVLPLDVRDSHAVLENLSQLPAQWQFIDILLNNAGLALGLDKLQVGNIADWETMIDVNIKGVLYVTQYMLRGMLARQQGHIINLGSISAHQVYSGGVVYCATKFALRAISEGLKMDVHGTPIRVSSVDPGMVKTEFSTVRFRGDTEKCDAVYRGVTPLTPEDVAEAVIFCATRPLHVDVREIKIYPVDQTAALLLHRSSE